MYAVSYEIRYMVSRLALYGDAFNKIMKRGSKMPANIVVGTQWGDEGKGKIIDIISSRADVVVRSQGGNNAGHTVVNNGEVYKLHLIPSGILYPNTLCLIGAGVVLDPKDFIGELDSLAERGIKTEGKTVNQQSLGL